MMTGVDKMLLFNGILFWQKCYSGGVTSITIDFLEKIKIPEQIFGQKIWIMKKNGCVHCEAEFQKVLKVVESQISYRSLPGWKGNRAASKRFQSSLFLVSCFQQFVVGIRLVLICFLMISKKTNELQLGSAAILSLSPVRVLECMGESSTQCSPLFVIWLHITSKAQAI